MPWTCEAYVAALERSNSFFLTSCLVTRSSGNQTLLASCVCMKTMTHTLVGSLRVQIPKAISSNAAQPSQPEGPEKALSVQPWYCTRILDRAKCWELRGSTTRYRGRGALAARGTNQLWAEATILVAHKNEHGDFCPIPGNQAAFPGLADNYDKHVLILRKRQDGFPFVQDFRSDPAAS